MVGSSVGVDKMTACRVVCLLATLACANANMHSSGACPCLYQGAHLTQAIYDNYPSKDPANCDLAVTDTQAANYCKKKPGMYKTKAAIKLYGTTCAAWDQVPDTPWHGSCTLTKNGVARDWSHKDNNWCQQPWCYVDSTCTGAKIGSSVFAGSTTAYYSYHACGILADCYTGSSAADYTFPTGCPYNPHGDGSYKVHEKGNCACMYQGGSLDTALYTNYPSEKPPGCQSNTAVTCTKTPGMYKNMASIKYYGTTCAAWDQMPGTPWYSSCPANSDWCHYDYNWCQQPWCYTSSNCASRVATSVFAGSTTAYYSYDTCLNTPDCYSLVAWNATPSPPAACPFDYSDNKWQTAKMCAAWTQPTSSQARVATFAGVALTLALATFLM